MFFRFFSRTICKSNYACFLWREKWAFRSAIRLSVNHQIALHSTVVRMRPAVSFYRHSNALLIHRFLSNIFPTRDVVAYSLLKEWLNEEDLYSTFEGFNHTSHTVLYQEASDPILDALVHACSMEEVFCLISTQDVLLNEKHASQAFVTLWDLQRFYCIWKSDCNQMDYVRSLREFVELAAGHPGFGLLVEMVDKSAALLSNEALATVLLCLRRFNIMPWDSSVHSLLCTSISNIKDFQLPELSKWCLALAMPSTAGRLIIPAACPVLDHHISKCVTAEDAKLISVCVITLGTVIHRSSCLSQNFVKCISALLDTRAINEDTPVPDLVKFLRALHLTRNVTSFSSSAIIRICGLLYKSKNLEDPSSAVYFRWIQKCWEALGEPIQLMEKCDVLARRWLENTDIRLDHLVLLNSVFYRRFPDRKRRLEECLSQILLANEPYMFEPYLKQICRLLNHLRGVNSDLVETFWQIALSCLEQRKNEREDFFYQLRDLFHWYLELNLHGSCRSISFERRTLDWFSSMKDWCEPVTSVRTFCRIFAFGIAFGRYQVAPELIKKALELEEQLSVDDVSNLSKAFAFLCNKYSRENCESLLIKLNLMLDRRTSALAVSPNTEVLEEVGRLLEAAIFRDSRSPLRLRIKSTPAHELMLKKFESQMNQLTVNSARDVINFLGQFRYLPHRILDHLIALVIERHAYSGPSLYCRTLMLCFKLGYTPPILQQLNAIVIEKFNSSESTDIFGLYILEGALALMLTDSLTPDLVQKIFSVSFLEKLDEEVQTSCKRDISDTARVRESLMRLNRAVCISMPEAGVPWFHENYCKSRLKTMNFQVPRKTSCRVDIYYCLAEVLGGPQFLKASSHSPYYHHIDFEVRLDRYGKPIALLLMSEREIPDEDVEKIAVLTWPSNCFTADFKSLGGTYQLDKRQLEILGYRVVGIPYHLWKSLALSSPQAKLNYLKEQLYRNSNKAGS